MLYIFEHIFRNQIVKNLFTLPYLQKTRRQNICEKKKLELKFFFVIQDGGTLNQHEAQGKTFEGCTPKRCGDF